MLGALNMGCLGYGKAATLAVGRAHRHVPSVNLAGVAGRSFCRAEEFARRYGIQRVYESSEALCDDSMLDAVYVGVPSHQHAQLASAALRGNKHVLVEKPICLRVEEFERIAALAQLQQRQFSEALMVTHHPWCAFVAELVHSKRYGELRNLKTLISFPLSNDRLSQLPSFEAGGGVCTDVAPYWCQLLQTVATLDFVKLDVEASSAGHPFDVHCSVRAELSGGARAELHASFARPYEARHVFEFEMGMVELPNIFRPNIGRTRFPVLEQATDGQPRTWSFSEANYYQNQLNEFARRSTPDRGLAQMRARVEVYEALRIRVDECLKGEPAAWPEDMG